MGNKSLSVLTFVIGVAVGVLASRRYFDKKYWGIAQEEIESVKEVYHRKRQQGNTETVTPESKEEELPEEDTTVLHQEGDKTVIQYAAILSNQKYKNVDYNNLKQTVDEVAKDEDIEYKRKEDQELGEPYIISPEEFGEDHDYEQVSLTYYNDRILANENDDQITDIEGLVGLEALETFGEYEDDSVFVRNDRLKVEFEILLDNRNFSDIIKRKPHEVD